MIIFWPSQRQDVFHNQQIICHDPVQLVGSMWKSMQPGSDTSAEHSWSSIACEHNLNHRVWNDNRSKWLTKTYKMIPTSAFGIRKHMVWSTSQTALSIKARQAVGDKIEDTKNPKMLRLWCITGGQEPVFQPGPNSFRNCVQWSNTIGTVSLPFLGNISLTSFNPDHLRSHHSILIICMENAYIKKFKGWPDTFYTSTCPNPLIASLLWLVCKAWQLEAKRCIAAEQIYLMCRSKILLANFASDFASKSWISPNGCASTQRQLWGLATLSWTIDRRSSPTGDPALLQICSKIICSKIICSKIICDIILQSLTQPHWWSSPTGDPAPIRICSKIICSKIICDIIPQSPIPQLALQPHWRSSPNPNLFKDHMFKDHMFKDHMFKDLAFKDHAFKDLVFKDHAFKDLAFKDLSYTLSP